MTCHGGGYDSTKHLARNAHFLPLDPNVVVFVKGSGIPDGVTRAGQEERIRQINMLTTGTPLTGAQATMLASLYGNTLQATGSTATGDTTPVAWNVKRGRRLSPERAASVLPDLPPRGPARRRRQRAPGVCDVRVAGGVRRGRAGGVRVRQLRDAQRAADVAGLLGHRQQPRRRDRRRSLPVGSGRVPGPPRAGSRKCNGLSQVSGCNRVSNPDSLCGGDVNGGATCDTVTGPLRAGDDAGGVASPRARHAVRTRPNSVRLAHGRRAAARSARSAGPTPGTSRALRSDKGHSARRNDNDDDRIGSRVRDRTGVAAVFRCGCVRRRGVATVTAAPREPAPSAWSRSMGCRSCICRCRTCRPARPRTSWPWSTSASPARGPWARRRASATWISGRRPTWRRRREATRRWWSP